MLATERKPNRLINEKSPYLLQHAHNPVDWYPWGPEAFQKARAEDKPVFLSIGYSTCHWCHVMERESFEDEEVAEALNRNFVAVKVDREERPDIDHIYMGVCQALTGAGGWPLTVFLDPDRRPFFAGTYYPKHSRWGRPGLLDILARVTQAWREDREALTASGDKLTAALRPKAGPGGREALGPDMLATAYRQLAEAFDERHGGFGPAPKFPTPHNLLFLLRCWRRTGEQKALAMVTKTLRAMREGGLYDHLGYGFARYSTDARWLVPHFEKMLYDNALLCCAYLEAYQASGQADFARVAGEVIDYVLRDMTSPEGGFYSAEDADSEGEEGKFYVWRPAEITAALGEEAGRIFAAFYGVTADGNFEHGTSILNFSGRDAGFARAHNVAAGELDELLAAGREKLYSLREKRVHPFKDDKILTAWNALMVVALAKAARVLGRSDYAAAAARALDFIRRKMTRADGRLLARYRDGAADFPAYLDDHAFLLWALLEMYEATFDPAYIDWAKDIAAVLEQLFRDETGGGFFFTAAGGEELITRPREIYDGAMPSGNSVAAYALLRLARSLQSEELAAAGERTLRAFAGEVARYPRAYTFYLMALEYYLEPPRQVVIAGPRAAAEPLIAVAAAGYLPTTSLLFNDSDNQAAVAAALPHIAGYRPPAAGAAAYVCEELACKPPVEAAADLADMLGVGNKNNY